MMKRAVGVIATVALLVAEVSGPRLPHRDVSPVPHVISGVDLHDGMVIDVGGIYYLYGTEYGCGFKWLDATTHWCGFGVASATSLDGPWGSITTLVHPTDTDPWSGRTWDAQCMRTNGDGCFNPRMIHRSDGAWILWFNTPDDWNYDRANAYNVMGCNGPMGPCGPSAGAPWGSYDKPRAYTCAQADGDFSIVLDGLTGYLECTGVNGSEYIESLDGCWCNGVGGGVGPLLANVEGAGAYHDLAAGLWISTLSWPECGYCDGTNTIYMTAPSMLGPWVTVPTLESGLRQAENEDSRASISANSCGGQPRTVDVLPDAGGVYQHIDLWLGTPNEAGAATLLVPMSYRNVLNAVGVPWRPFDFNCP